jgi:hypothetical protein
LTLESAKKQCQRVRKMRKKQLPEYCIGCGNRMNTFQCRGWVDPSGCNGEYYKTIEQAEQTEREIREYAGLEKPVKDADHEN